jgi:hypothetical protein
MSVSWSLSRRIRTAINLLGVGMRESIRFKEFGEGLD